MNLFSAQGQSSPLTNDELSQLVKKAEKLQADNTDLQLIVADQKLILEAQSVRLVEKEETIQSLNAAVQNIKIAYNNLAETHQKKRTWRAIKNIGTGIVIGGAAVFISSLKN